MKIKKTILAACALIILGLHGAGIRAQDSFKQVTMRGLRIYSSEFLAERLGLNSLPAGKAHFDEVARKINWFYHKEGYILASTFLVEETDLSLVLYVDEGQLGKIIFHDLNTLDTLRMKYDFNLPRRVYNRQRVEDEVNRLKKKYSFRDLYALIKPVRSYEGTLFQLDRDVAVPMMGEARRLFFEEYGNRYDLDLFIAREPSSAPRGSSWKYGFDINYTKGLIPYARYRWPSMITDGDRMEIGASTGIYYGLDLKFANIPQVKFMEAHSKYNFTPTLEDYFVPVVKSSIYNSRASRSDLGLKSYNYTLVRATGDPGIVILKKFKLYAGYGGEKAFIFDSRVDTESGYQASVERGTEYWNIAEAEVVLDIIPWTLKGTLERKFILTYDYYFNKVVFHELLFKGDVTHEFGNFDIYSLHADFSRLWGMVPFYHEVQVDGDAFRGLLGKGYHSRRVLRLSNEYRISLYRDFIYGGVFADGAWFRGSGYDLDGEQYAGVAGISGHFIFLDQFEFNIYYGKDYLLAEEKSQMNLYFNMQKKW